MSEGFVKSTTESGITSIQFYHPLSNSMPGVLLQQLGDALLAAGNNNDSKVVVLSSNGDGAFCAGASFDELLALENLEESKAFFGGFAKVINAIRTCGKLVIARVHGKVVGGGVGIVCAADYAIATSKADIKLSELTLGIGPFVIGPAVERKIGLAAFSGLTIDASNFKNAYWALQKGMYNHVYETVADMDNAVDALAEKLAASDANAMGALKQQFWSGTENWEALLAEKVDLVAPLALSDYTQKALQRFRKK